MSALTTSTPFGPAERRPAGGLESASERPSSRVRNPQRAAPRLARGQRRGGAPSPCTPRSDIRGCVQVVGIVSAGAMGSALGARLRGGGVRVIVALDGRSARTRRLAAEAGLEDVGALASLLREAEVVLSVVPPEAAVGFASAIAEAAAGASPVVADLNAVSPALRARDRLAPRRRRDRGGRRRDLGPAARRVPARHGSISRAGAPRPSRPSRSTGSSASWWGTSPDSPPR